MLQRQYCLFFLYRHKTPLLCYNVNIVCSFYIVIKRRFYASTSILSVLPISSSNAVVMLQPQYCLFYYFLIKRRCYATTKCTYLQHDDINIVKDFWPLFVKKIANSLDFCEFTQISLYFGFSTWTHTEYRIKNSTVTYTFLAFWGEITICIYLSS